MYQIDTPAWQRVRRVAAGSRTAPRLPPRAQRPAHGRPLPERGLGVGAGARQGHPGHPRAHRRTDAAIHEVEAASLDGKNLNDRFPSTATCPAKPLRKGQRIALRRPPEPVPPRRRALVPRPAQPRPDARRLDPEHRGLGSQNRPLAVILSHSEATTSMVDYSKVKRLDLTSLFGVKLFPAECIAIPKDAHHSTALSEI